MILLMKKAWSARKAWLAAAVIAALITTGCSSGNASRGGLDRNVGGQSASLDLIHVHGLGYSPDGTQLYVPAHDGFRVFSDGLWARPPGTEHDYMGYVATDDGFYSSGHPSLDSDLVNPLGLVKSTDLGQSIVTLGFAGQSDFHVMGVGYYNHAIYVANNQPNPTLPEGVHHSLDDGKTWKASALQGLMSLPLQIAVHPTQANRIAVATEFGLFLSDDYGETVSPLGEETLVTATQFSLSGAELYAGSKTLLVYNPATGKVRELSVPQLKDNDAISYIAVAPERPEELVFATFLKNIYRSVDGGATWVAIALEGKVQQIEP